MNALTRSLALCLALVGLVTLSACDSASGDGATASGTVENTFGNPVQGATVEFTSTNLTPGGSNSATTGGGVECITEADGDFSCEDLAEGDYTVTVSVSGYTTRTFAQAVGTGDLTVDVPALSGEGSINSELINAVTGGTINSTTIHCHRLLADGITYSTNAEFEATSSALGVVVINGVFTGQGRCQVPVGSNTYPAVITITSNYTAPITVVPPPAAGEYRVVLRWGSTPDDLDSHLTGPDGSGRFHVYYANPTFDGHNLDVDDTSAFGPETITIVPAGVNGMYRYSVHNYSDQSTSGSTGIANSVPATTVEVYNSSGLLRTFTAPTATAGNTWRVFEMTVSGSSVTFSPGTGTSGLGYFTASSPGDTGTFLTGGEPGIAKGTR